MKILKTLSYLLGGTYLIVGSYCIASDSFTELGERNTAQLSGSIKTPDILEESLNDFQSNLDSFTDAVEEEVDEFGSAVNRSVEVLEDLHRSTNKFVVWVKKVWKKIKGIFKRKNHDPK